MKKLLKTALWLLAAAVFVGTFVFLYFNSRSKAETYTLLSPSKDITIEQSTILTGKIEPRDEINIKPQISGIIAEIFVQPGDQVAEGDVIARIKVIPSASELSAAQNRVEVARIALADASQKQERARIMYENKVGSREDFETADANMKRAKLELDGAIDAYSIVRDGISQNNASESNTNVRSTITGLVLDVPVKVGSSVIQANTMNDGTTVATIADMNNLIFKGKVDETEVGTLHVGMPMDITIGAIPDFRASATVEYIAPKGVESNGANTFEIKAALRSDSVSQLRSGYSANASVVLHSLSDMLSVPEMAVEFEGDSAYVYVLTDSVPEQRFERRPISTGLSDGINVHVKGGIDPSARLRGNIIKD